MHAGAFGRHASKGKFEVLKFLLAHGPSWQGSGYRAKVHT
mgnify:CR=1 FL=1